MGTCAVFLTARGQWQVRSNCYIYAACEGYSSIKGDTCRHYFLSLWSGLHWTDRSFHWNQREGAPWAYLSVPVVADHGISPYRTRVASRRRLQRRLSAWTRKLVPPENVLNPSHLPSVKHGKRLVLLRTRVHHDSSILGPPGIRLQGPGQQFFPGLSFFCGPVWSH
jgi:hypothetical protein